MPKEDDDKGCKTKREEHAEKSKEQHASTGEKRDKRKTPEPAENLRRRAEWFKKRH